MPDTLIPEQVTISGDVLYKALVDLETVENILIAANGGQETPLDGLLSEAIWAIATPAFGLVWEEKVPGETTETEFGESLLRDSRSRADEWFGRSND